MKSQIAAMSLFVLTPFLAVGQDKVSGYVESETLISSTSATPQVNVYLQGPIASSKRFGWSAWSLTSKGWSEAYAGPTWTPASWISLSASIGLETDKKPMRLSASSWIGKGKFASLTIHETGGSGYWYKEVATYQATPKTNVGVYSQRFTGTGPYADRKLGKFLVWGTILRYQGHTQALVGLRFNFGQ